MNGQKRQILWSCDHSKSGMVDSKERSKIVENLKVISLRL